jgi:hypothetical protein
MKKKTTAESDNTISQQTIKGYKVFNKDFSCRGFQFSENSEFKFEGKISICNSGFHFCTKAQDCFSYYDFNPENIVCEVEALGETQTHDEDSKVCTNHIKIGRRLLWQEVLLIANTGKDNTGHSNSGDRNSGDRNSGDSNSGNWNSGNRNSGDRTAAVTLEQRQQEQRRQEQRQQEQRQLQEQRRQ